MPKKLFSVRNILALAVIGLVIFLFANEGFRKMAGQYIELHKMKARSEVLRTENKMLSDELRLLQTDEKTFERIAKRELGYVGEGEVEYRIPR